VIAAAQDDVHDPLVGPIAIFQRDLLGKDLDPPDRLGRQILDRVEAGDALAVDQHDRRRRCLFARVALAALDLGGEVLEHLREVSGAERADRGRVERRLGLDRGRDRALLTIGDDEDLVLRLLRRLLGVGRAFRLVRRSGSDGRAVLGEGGRRMEQAGQGKRQHARARGCARCCHGHDRTPTAHRRDPALAADVVVAWRGGGYGTPAAAYSVIVD